MKIALLWPDYWPYVRRGTERMVHDIAHYLAAQGHTVHILATKPGPGVERDEDRVRVILSPQKSHPLLLTSRWVPRFDTHPVQVLPLLLRERYDLVHAFFYTYAPVLAALKRLRGTPYIYHVVTIPPAWKRRGDETLLRLALRGAAGVRVFSRWCAEYMEQHYGVQAAILPPIVDQQVFRPSRERDREQRRILFTGDLAEERKGAHWLVDAFNQVHRRFPDTRLVLAGPSGSYIAETKRFIAGPSGSNVAKRIFARIDDAVRDAVLFPGTGCLDALPGLYSEATVTVLPARGEPFGMVLTESLSCGTPVAGARSGAIPEIVSDPGIGTLFDIHEQDSRVTVQNLTEALTASLSLALEEDAAERCRQHAAEWTWSVQGPRLEALQTAALEQSHILEYA